MSNVKAGDLGILCGLIENTEDNGKLVEVIDVFVGRRWTSPEGILFRWNGPDLTAAVRSLGTPFLGEIHDTFQYAPLSIRNVKPLRDPGPEAVDEMVQKLGSPNKQGEMA